MGPIIEAKVLQEKKTVALARWLLGKHLVRRHADGVTDARMILETEAKSLFALELPIRISGPFGDISAGPSAAALVMKSPGDGAAAMPAEMRRLVDGNPCRL